MQHRHPNATAEATAIVDFNFIIGSVLEDYGFTEKMSKLCPDTNILVMSLNKYRHIRCYTYIFFIIPLEGVTPCSGAYSRLKKFRKECFFG